MIKAARVLNLLVLVLVAAACIAATFSAVSDYFGDSGLYALLGSLAFGVVVGVVLSPFILANFALRTERPRFMRSALTANKLAAFVISAGLIAVIFRAGESPYALSYLPLILWLLPASMLNVAALNRLQRT
jgi:hypothetical protein